LLVRNRERVVSKEELVRVLWPDVVVNDNALAQCVWAARRALGDGGRVQVLIKNVRGRGYRFIGVVEESSSSRTQSPTPATRPLVGRDSELEWLCLALEEARAGTGRICLLGGEAGIGKTRIANECSARALNGGFVVLEGRGNDDETMPPFWPWKQVLRAFKSAWTERQLAELAGGHAADLTKLIPELRHLLPSTPDAATRDADDERYFAFQAVTELLTRASASRPIFVVLDDVHWLDASSLRLLKFMAPSLGAAHICLLATFRSDELEGACLRTLDFIARHPGAERRELGGLGRDSIAAILSGPGQVACPEVVERITRIAAGNPLFTLQLAPLLANSTERPTELALLELPVAIRDALGRRLSKLCPSARAVLRFAAALGHECKLSDLRIATHLETTEVLTSISELVAQRVLLRAAGDHGLYEFSHPLMRETVYRSVPEGERILLHRSIAEAIEGAYAEWPSARLDDLTHHYVAAAAAGVAAKALHYARLSAEQAFEATAFEAAVGHYRSALGALDLCDVSDEPERCELLIGLGHALRGSRADVTQIRTMFQEAAHRARVIERPELFADAALGFAGGGGPLHLGALTEMGIVDPVEVDLLSSAVELLGPGDSEKKVLVLAWLARALYQSSEQARRTEAADEAVAMARRLASPQLLAAALHHRQQVLRSPHVLAQRIGDLTELIGLTERTRARQLEVDARVELAWAFVQTARIAEAEREVQIAFRLAAELRHGGSTTSLENWQLVHAYVRDNVDDVHERDQERLSRRRNERTTQAFGCRLMMARFMQDRATETIELNEEYARHMPLPMSWRCGLCSTYAIVGRFEDSRTLFEELALTGFSGVPMTHDWLSAYVLLASACCLLRDEKRAPIFVNLLAPFEGNVLVMGLGTFLLCPVALALCELHTLLGNFSEAERCADISARLASELRSPAIVAWTMIERADIHARRGAPGDRARAEELVAAAGAAIASTGFVYLYRRGREILSST
jgi:hypothetical protein